MTAGEAKVAETTTTMMLMMKVMMMTILLAPFSLFLITIMAIGRRICNLVQIS